MVGLKQWMRNDAGFTVIELVVAAAILFVVSTGIMGVLAYASTSNSANSVRQAALELANTRMEASRNTSFTDIGTTSNYPVGTIVSPETVVVSTPEGNRTFVVTTEVDYSWDQELDQESTGAKDIRITVSWTIPRPGSVSVESFVAGRGVINGGTVIVNVVDSDTGDPVPGATITIKPSTGMSATKMTSSDGMVRWGAVPTGSMVITGTCSTHFLDLAPLAGASVQKSPPANEYTIQAERASTGTVHVVDQAGNSLPGVEVTIQGTSGTLTAVSDGSGDAFFPTLRKGTYTVTGVKSGYQVESSPPYLGITVGGGTYTADRDLVMNQRTTIKVKVVDSSDNPISGVTLSATGVTFGSTTDSNGESTSNDMGSIGTNKTYTVTAAKTGYQNVSGTVTMSQFTQGTLTLTMALVPPTTIKVTVKDASNNPISGVTVSASGVTFASTTDANGQATSNDMGAIGSNKTYTVTASKSGWVTKTGTVTFSQYTQGTLTIVLATAPVDGTLVVTYTSSLSSSKIIYIYSSSTANGTPIAQQTVTSGSPSASFSLPAGTYWASRRSPYGASGALPKSAVVTSGNTTNLSISSSN